MVFIIDNYKKEMSAFTNISFFLNNTKMQQSIFYAIVIH